MEKTEITALVQRSKSGDKDAFLTLYKEFHGKVSFFVRRLTNNTEAAADITSDTFTDAMERIAELNSGESFSGWLYSIAYNKCMQYINEKKRSVTLSSEAELEELLESAALNEPLLLPEDYAICSETRTQLLRIIDGLSPDQRSVVILYYYDEMTVSEVAEAMGTNENNVSQKLHRARKKIRAQVEKLIGRGAMFGAVPMGSLLRDLGTSGVGMAAVGAAAVGIPYGLSKASGGTARELLWITRKYWSKHKKNLAALMFSGVLLCAVVTCIFLMMKQSFIRDLDDEYDRAGYYSLIAQEDRQHFRHRPIIVYTAVFVVIGAGVAGAEMNYVFTDETEGLAVGVGVVDKLVPFLQIPHIAEANSPVEVLPLFNEPRDRLYK